MGLNHPGLTNKDFSQQKEKCYSRLELLKNTVRGLSKVKFLQFGGRNTGFGARQTYILSTYWKVLGPQMHHRVRVWHELLKARLMHFLNEHRIQDTQWKAWMSCPQKLIPEALASFSYPFRKYKLIKAVCAMLKPHLRRYFGYHDVPWVVIVRHAHHYLWIVEGVCFC